MRRIALLGAAGRDSHNSNVVFRDDPTLQVVAPPIDLTQVISLKKPSVRVSYESGERTRPGLQEVLRDVVNRAKALRNDRIDQLA